MSRRNRIVTYEEALMLKKQGYTWPCDNWYRPFDRKLFKNCEGFSDNSNAHRLSAPRILEIAAFLKYEIVLSKIATIVTDAIFIANCLTKLHSPKSHYNLGGIQRGSKVFAETGPEHIISFDKVKSLTYLKADTASIAKAFKINPELLNTEDNSIVAALKRYEKH